MQAIIQFVRALLNLKVVTQKQRHKMLQPNRIKCYNYRKTAAVFIAHGRHRRWIRIQMNEYGCEFKLNWVECECECIKKAKSDENEKWCELIQKYVQSATFPNHNYHKTLPLGVFLFVLFSSFKRSLMVGWRVRKMYTVNAFFKLPPHALL